jgi:uncharacterized protein with beta-barrel porin domain
MHEAALYGKATIDNAYLSAVAAYGFHDVVTSRHLDIGGGAQYDAEFGAHDIAAAVEGGYNIGWFTPYVGARIQGYLTPGYSEDTVSGSDMFAQNHDSQFDLTARTEIGIRVNASKDFDGGQLLVHGALAWAHSYWTDNLISASFQALPGSSFTTASASSAADLLLVSGGLGVELDNGVSLDGTLGANLALNAQTYKASLRLGYSF